VIRRNRRESGFTLLEVMVALAMVAGVLLTVITAFNYHLSIAARDRQEVTAVLLAREKLEEIELKPPREMQGSFAPYYPQFRWEAESGATELAGVKKVTVKVRREDGDGAATLVHYLPQ